MTPDELARHERALLDAEPMYARDPEAARELRAALADVRTMTAEAREARRPRTVRELVVALVRHWLGR